ncbi:MULTISPECIES: DUF3579 domain-containing protein [Hydrogenophilus]|jgi:hypothetical protein|uniref:DUF3579 domain-containing protein n=1 Tax=Hydrogenophilus thermoluteolus TaxID=297 RepID=A0A2Z6DYU0_HYDTE|nr:MULTISPECIES: DUF3579 domain-containing protein [Hydrogenophilus]HCO77881.1 hypothetical protein [Rhodocyclaceae bacterium]MBW7655752.1 DUF3579 domain-containing protein [Hydrogenophilus thermoluteolus]BBD77425.1 hypothetical protein HPTL_1161 [Hydrogenophilus thermoluteolus]GLW59660.1 hypothetical protein Hthe01_00090 [Hydrogenophilus thermoluteolus]HNQ47802.1 DUF3579 domain-containing protein [Hydrogenophilus thermoluteolus]
MENEVSDFLIVGRTVDGRRFRPSDWAERLCGIMATMGADNRMRYSPYVRPGPMIDGAKTVEVDAKLYHVQPMAYRFLVNFAKDNNLEIRYRDVCTVAPPEKEAS